MEHSQRQFDSVAEAKTHGHRKVEKAFAESTGRIDDAPQEDSVFGANGLTKRNLKKAKKTKKGAEVEDFENRHTPEQKPTEDPPSGDVEIHDGTKQKKRNKNSHKSKPVPQGPEGNSSQYQDTAQNGVVLPNGNLEIENIIRPKKNRRAKADEVGLEEQDVAQVYVGSSNEDSHAQEPIKKKRKKRKMATMESLEMEPLEMDPLEIEPRPSFGHRHSPQSQELIADDFDNGNNTLPTNPDKEFEPFGETQEQIPVAEDLAVLDTVYNHGERPTKKKKTRKTEKYPGNAIQETYNRDSQEPKFATADIELQPNDNEVYDKTSRKKLKMRKISTLNKAEKSMPDFQDRMAPKDGHSVNVDAEEVVHGSNMATPSKNKGKVTKSKDSPSPISGYGEPLQPGTTDGSVVIQGESLQDTADSEPKRPSKKALGKMKAVDKSISGPPRKNSNLSKSQKRCHPGQDLRTMGFSADRVSGSLQHVPDLTTSLLGALSRKTYAGWDDSIDTEPSSPQLSVSSSKKATRKSETTMPSHSPQSSNDPKPWNANNKTSEPRDFSDSETRQPSSKDESEEPAETVGSSLEVVKPKPRRQRRHHVDDEPGSFDSQPKKNFYTESKTKRSKTSMKPITEAPTPRGKLASQLNEIDRAVDDYRTLNNLTQYQMNELIQSSGNARPGQLLWRALYENLPDIPHRKLQNTCRRRFHNFEARGAWAPEDDEELRKAYEQHPGRWKMIGEILNRFPEDIRDRWRNYLVCGETRKTDIWMIEEEGQLREAVKECLEKIRNARLENKIGTASEIDDEKLIDWQEVSLLMNRTRSRLQCRNKWQFIKAREVKDAADQFETKPIALTVWRLGQASNIIKGFTATDKLRLLTTIRDSGASREGKIPWASIKKDLDGEGKRMAWRLCFQKLQENIPGYRDMDFKDILEWLIGAFESTAPDEPEGYEIPTEELKSKKRKRKMRSQRGEKQNNADLSNDEYLSHDNGEGLSTHRKRKRGQSDVEDANSPAPIAKKKRKSHSHNELQFSADENTPESSKTKHSHDHNHGDEEFDATEDTSNKNSLDKHPVDKHKRKSRRRMLKQDESQETVNSPHYIENVAASGNVSASFQAVGHSAAVNGRNLSSKNRKTYLSAEIVAESETEEDEPHVFVNITEDEIDVDHREARLMGGSISESYPVSVRTRDRGDNEADPSSDELQSPSSDASPGDASMVPGRERSTESVDLDSESPKKAWREKKGSLHL
jgi:hypothetical protein